MIGLGLANVAWFLIRSNTKYLVGQSISQDTVMDIQDALEDRNTVKAIMDVKATYLGPDRVRLKAEVQFDGRQVAKNYLSIYSNTEIDDQFRYINSLPDHEEHCFLTKEEAPIKSRDRFSLGSKAYLKVHLWTNKNHQSFWS